MFTSSKLLKHSRRIIFFCTAESSRIVLLITFKPWHAGLHHRVVWAARLGKHVTPGVEWSLHRKRSRRDILLAAPRVTNRTNRWSTQKPRKNFWYVMLNLTHTQVQIIDRFKSLEINNVYSHFIIIPLHRSVFGLFRLSHRSSTYLQLDYNGLTSSFIVRRETHVFVIRAMSAFFIRIGEKCLQLHSYRVNACLSTF